MDMKVLTKYASVSERTVRDWTQLPVNPLPAVRVRGKLLFRRSTFDQWLESHKLQPTDVGSIVKEIVDGVIKEN
jgi:excisionase family DNA binding protein